LTGLSALMLYQNLGKSASVRLNWIRSDMAQLL